MRFIYESQGINTFLVCELSQDDVMDSMTMGMISNNKIEGIIPFSYSQMDLSRYVKYNVSSKVNLKQYFSGIVNKYRLISILESVSFALLNAQDYMLEKQNFVLDTQYIFVDVSSIKAQLICLPIQMEYEEYNLESFFKQLIFSVQFDQSENCDYVAKLIGFFNSSVHFSLVDFHNMLKQLSSEKSTSAVAKSVEADVVQTRENQSEQNLKNNQHMERLEDAGQNNIVIAKEEHKIPGNPDNNIKAGFWGKGQAGSQPKIPAVTEEKDKKQKDKAQKEKNQKEKIGLGLFGKKKEKKEIEMAVDFKIPGQQETMNSIQVTEYEGGLKSFNRTQTTAIHTSQVDEKKNSVLNTGSIYNVASSEGSGNFGETTVLLAKNGETTVLCADIKPEICQPYIIRMKTNEKIMLNKPVFRIGKEKSYVDYFVNDNTAISRSHANFITKDGAYFVTDTNSTNHTFVNGQMIPSNVETPLQHGMKVRLANEDFEFRTY